MPPTFFSNLEETLGDEIVENYIYGISSLVSYHLLSMTQAYQIYTDMLTLGNTSGMSSSKSPDQVGPRSHHFSPDDFLDIPPSNAELPPGIDWKEGLFHDRESYSSFGEKGTTASVNAYGSILQISRYLGRGASGIYCADPCISEPWYLSRRMRELLNLSTDAKGGFGVCLNPELASPKPRLQFLHGRWPRYTHDIRDLSVSIQYFANRGAIIQQYSFQRTREHEAKNGAEDSDAHTSRDANEDVSQKLHGEDAIRSQAEATQMQEDQMQHDQIQNQPYSEDRTQEGQIEHSLPQNETQNGETPRNIQKDSIKDCLRLNSKFQIRESEWEEGWNDFNMEYPNGAAYHTITGQNRYSLVTRHRMPAPARDEAVGLVIAVFVNNRATKIAKTQDESHSGTYEIDFDHENVHAFERGWGSKSDNSLEITVVYKLQHMAERYSWKSTLIPFSVLDLSDLVAQNSYSRSLSLSTSEHLNFIMKRNLEHILSVCSIPVSNTPIQDADNDEEDAFKRSKGETQANPEDSRGDPIALTCGDISGHHVLVSASL